MRARKLGRMPREAPHNASRRIQSTDPHQSHKHEELGKLAPRGEPEHNRARRLQHTAVSGAGVGIARIIEAAKAKKARRMIDA
jgi:hypothetical protein